MSKRDYAPCFDCQTKLRPPYAHTVDVVREETDARGRFISSTDVKEPLCTPCWKKRT